MSTFMDCIFVGAGGALGAVFRYLMGLLPIRSPSGFPMTTLIINVMGAFCIGLIVSIAGKHTDFDPRVLLFLKVGLCGGFTTFSTFSHETMLLFQRGRLTMGILYIVLSVILCVVAVAGAQAMVKA